MASFHTIPALLLAAACLVVTVSLASAAAVVPPITLHFVSHSHDDAGWLKTYGQYQRGLNDTIQRANVNEIYDSVIESLQRNPARKFTAVEMAFFVPWFRDHATQATRATVRALVANGQLQFAGGGWVMHDEATASWHDMVDQMHLGHEYIRREFGEGALPTTGWQIDPFGHSVGHNTLFGRGAGMHSTVHSRVDFADMAFKQRLQAREGLWAPEAFRAATDLARPPPPPAAGSQQQPAAPPLLFTSTMVHSTYCPPPAFNFDVLAQQSAAAPPDLGPLARDLLRMASSDVAVTSGSHVLVAMGCDFAYQQAESWFRSIDALIGELNRNPRVVARYSTPREYIECKAAETARSQTRARSSAEAGGGGAVDEAVPVAAQPALRWPVFSGDALPYADGPSAVWAGFFTSRSSFKRQVREASSMCRALGVAAALDDLQSDAPPLRAGGGGGRVAAALEQCREAVALVQHHDAVTGTAKQHVSDDYTQRLASANSAAAGALAALANPSSPSTSAGAVAPWDHCPLRNQSRCPPVDAWLQNTTAQDLHILLANPLGERVAAATIDIPLPRHLAKLPLSVAFSTASTDAEVRWRAAIAARIDSDMQPLPCEGYAPSSNTARRSSKAAPDTCYFGALRVSVSLPAFASRAVLVVSANASADGAAASRKSQSATVAQARAAFKARPLAAAQEVQAPRRETAVAVGAVTLHLSANGSHITGLSVGNTTVRFTQSWCWYAASAGSKERTQPSGAYVFRPSVLATCEPLPGGPPSLFKTEVLTPAVAIVSQRVASFVTQRVTVDALATPPVRVEYFVDAVPIGGDVGREVVMRFAIEAGQAAAARLPTQWLSDTNGLPVPLVRRVMGERVDFPLTPAAVEGDAGSAIAREFVPVQSVALVAAAASPNASAPAPVGLGLFPDRATGIGMTRPGVLEALLQRRLLHDDARGVGEPLNETRHIADYVDCEARQWAADLATERNEIHSDPALVCGGRSGGGIRITGSVALGVGVMPVGFEVAAATPMRGGKNERWWRRPSRDALSPVVAVFGARPATTTPSTNAVGRLSATTLPQGLSLALLQPVAAGSNSTANVSVRFTVTNTRWCPVSPPSTTVSVLSAQRSRWLPRKQWQTPEDMARAAAAKACLANATVDFDPASVLPHLFAAGVGADVPPTCPAGVPPGPTESVPSCVCVGGTSLTSAAPFASAVRRADRVLRNFTGGRVAAPEKSRRGDPVAATHLAPGEVRSFVVELYRRT